MEGRTDDVVVSRRMTCPTHLHRLCKIMELMLSYLYRAKRSQLKMFSDQKVRNIFLRFVEWDFGRVMMSFLSSSNTMSVQEGENNTAMTHH